MSAFLLGKVTKKNLKKRTKNPRFTTEAKTKAYEKKYYYYYFCSTIFS